MYFRFICGLLLFLTANVGHAHNGFSQNDDFLAGLFHPFTTPEHLLLLFAFGVLIGQQSSQLYVKLAFIFPIVVIVGACSAMLVPGLHPLPFLHAVFCILIGGLIVLNCSVPKYIFYALMIIFGWMLGYENGLEITDEVTPLLFIAGIGLAVVIIVVDTMVITEFVLKLKKAWLPIAVRVIGSWITAIGLLMLGISYPFK